MRLTMPSDAIDELEELVNQLLARCDELRKENRRLTNAEATLLKKCDDAQKRIGATVQQLKRMHASRADE